MNKTILEQCVEETEALNNNPEGLVSVTGRELGGKGDNIIIRQNNTIIKLLEKIYSKLEKLDKTPTIPPSIDEITEAFSKIKVTRKPKITSKLLVWKA